LKPQKKQLIIFDIDGTLLDSMNIDSECYIKSLKNEFGITNINDDWTIYKNASDSGIFEEIYNEYYKTSPNPDDYKKHENGFFKIYDEKLSNNIYSFSEIPGAKNIISTINSLPNNFISFATGSYKKTALLKLKHFNISENDFPLSTANDAKAREEIINLSIKKAKRVYSINKFDKVISIGDEIWDLKTAINLSLPFIGIGINRFNKLSNCLALDNFKDTVEFLNSIKKSFVPKFINN
jgi:phosphoglycolate phosphatase-like HAD superfamily hydrolase